MFALSLKNGDNAPTTNSLDKYYMPLVEIKDFKTVIDNKPFWYTCEKNSRCVWKTCQNVKKRWLYSKKFITFISPSKLL